jgi:hypothetical protein
MFAQVKGNVLEWTYQNNTSRYFVKWGIFVYSIDAKINLKYNTATQIFRHYFQSITLIIKNKNKHKLSGQNNF